jgi:Iap family predicted aminopeptidase
VAVLVELAGRFAREPIEDADVWFVATGSKESWMCGMRRFLRTHALDKDTTYFLNIDEVGLGSLRYLTSEGMLSSFSADREMVEVAKSLAVSSGAQPRRWRGLPTDALLPLVRGYKALGITAVGGRTDFEGETDRPGAVDYNTVAQAADFAEGIVRGVNSGSGV